MSGKILPTLMIFLFSALRSIGVPKAHLATIMTLGIPGLIYHLLIPMAAVFVIVYGFLEKINIFDNKTINIVLTIIIGLTSLYSGIFFIIIEWMFRFMGLFSVAIFGLMFVLGVWFYKNRRLAEWSSAASVEGTFSDLSNDLRKEISNRRKEYEQLAEQLAGERKWWNRRNISSRMKRINKEINDALSRAKELREERET